MSENEDVAVEDAQKGAMLAWVQALAPYGILTTDTELRIRSWNQWLASHSGLRAEDVIGRVLGDVFPYVRERRLDEHWHRRRPAAVADPGLLNHHQLRRPRHNGQSTRSYIPVCRVKRSAAAA